MAGKKAKNLIDVLQRSLGPSGPSLGSAKGSRPGARPRKPAGPSSRAGGIGERRIQLSLSLNALLGLAVALAVLLAGMYGLGRYQALSGGGEGGGPALASMEMRSPASPRGARSTRAAAHPGRPVAASARKEARPAKTLKGLCVISYAYTAKGKKRALQMAEWLRSQGLPRALYASYASRKGKSWMVVVPLGKESPGALMRRVLALKAPPFAERTFRFADQKMFFVTLRVGG